MAEIKFKNHYFILPSGGKYWTKHVTLTNLVFGSSMVSLLELRIISCPAGIAHHLYNFKSCQFSTKQQRNANSHMEIGSRKKAGDHLRNFRDIVPVLATVPPDQLLLFARISLSSFLKLGSTISVYFPVHNSG